MAKFLSEQEVFRREALTELRNMGIEPFPAAEYPVTHKSTDINKNYETYPEAFAEVCVAGRLMTKGWSLQSWLTNPVPIKAFILLYSTFLLTRVQKQAYWNLSRINNCPNLFTGVKIIQQLPLQK